MRIISGYHRGRVLRPPAGLPLRPTTDLAKESLFNILNNYIDFEAIHVLDLFAGTGNISLEFASRGAKSILSVEINPRCADYIKKTASELDFPSLTVLKGNVFHFLSKSSGKYDVIFADPPYDLPEREKVPELIFNNHLLCDEGWFIMEHDSFINFNNHPRFHEQRRYGKVHFSIFR